MGMAQLFAPMRRQLSHGRHFTESPRQLSPGLGHFGTSVRLLATVSSRLARDAIPRSAPDTSAVLRGSE
jgi:hypothetical protein